MQIFHKHERRDLSSAVRHYLGREHRGGHRAGADAYAAAAMLDAQLRRYPELPRTVPELHGCLSSVDLAGRLGRREDGAVAFTLGKYADVPLAEVARQDPGYLRWLLGQDFLPDVRGLTKALDESAN
jgi:DNA polymerase-3 subunit epsilon